VGIGVGAAAVIACSMLAMASGGVGQDAGAGGARARVEPAAVPVAAEVVVRVIVTTGRPLRAGAVVSTQLPSAMLAADLSYSLTKTLQVRDPAIVMPVAPPATAAPNTAGAAPSSTNPAAAMPANFQQFTRWHTVTVEAPSAPGATFDVRIEKREIELGRADSRHGQVVNATLKDGALPAGADVVFTYRTTAPWVASRDYRVYAAIDGARVSPDATFAVTPGPAETHRVIVPSSAKPGAPFRVLLVSLDRYANQASTPAHETTISLGSRVLARGITYTGRSEVSVSLAEAGVHRLTANGVTSNPIRITPTPSGPWWGDLHNHNDADHDAASGGNSHEYARDVSGLDFYALSNHVNGGAPLYWARAQQRCRDFYAPGRFVPLLAFETGLAIGATGPHMTATFADCEQPAPPHMEAGKRSVALADLAALLGERPVVTTVHHTGVIWAPNDFRANTAFLPSTRAIEIYSSHGQSERYDTADALSYEQQVSAPFTLSVKGPNYAQDAWSLGHHFTTVASSDDHNGQPGKPFNGLTAVSAPRLDRAAIFEGLTKGITYGTTGERVLLDVEVNGAPMGSTLRVAAGESLSFRIEVHGTGPIEAVEVMRWVRGGDTGWEVAHARRHLSTADLVDTWTESARSGAIYYVRVIQANANEVFVPVHGLRPVTAWSSPIWIEAPGPRSE